MYGVVCIALIIIILCVFFDKREGFATDVSGSALAVNMGQMIQTLVPKIRVRLVESEFTTSDPQKLSSVLRAELQTPMLQQGNEISRQDR